SYARIQVAVSWLLRGRKFQLCLQRVATKEYLDVGCGPNTHDAFVNLEYSWHPKIDLCWDINKGIPLPDGSLKGIFSEHCLEHFSLTTVGFILREFRRLMRPGGTVRIVVPDAGLYLGIYQRKSDGDATAQFPYQAADLANGLKAPLVSVNRIF